MRFIQVGFDTRSVNSNDFDVEFNSTFNLDEEPNEVEVYIKNLSATTINTYIKKDKRLVVNAGYAGDFGTISSGFIIDVDTGWNGSDKDTAISGFDATQQYLDTFISKSYGKGITALQIIMDLLKITGLTVGEITLVKNIQYANGRVVTGKVRNILKEIVVKDCQTNLQITNGAVFIRAIAQGLETGFILSPETGLIGSPEPMEDVKDEPEEKRPTHSCRCLLNYRIRPMVRIKIQSKVLKADAVVIRGTHTGSRSGTFETYMEVKVI